MHKPFEKNNADSDTIVIFSHGFLGSPDQFHDLADLAYQNGCSVLSLLLPGHGGAAKELSKVRLTDWESHLENEIRRASSAYKNIILVGHSIGGLLSINASLNKALSIKHVLLISSPLRLKYSLSTILMGFRLRFSKKDDEILEAYRSSNSVVAGSIFSYFLYLRQVFDVYRLISKTKSQLHKVTVPATVITSKKDETASVNSSKIFDKLLVNANKKIIVLSESRHVFCVPKEREIIRQELINIINSLSAQ